MNYKKTLLEKLEVWGTIVIMDKEEGDYQISVSPINVNIVRNILDIELGINNYELEYKWQIVKYEIDFNLYARERKEGKIPKANVEVESKGEENAKVPTL